jgi:hypothetical protein
MNRRLIGQNLRREAGNVSNHERGKLDYNVDLLTQMLREGVLLLLLLLYPSTLLSK